MDFALIQCSVVPVKKIESSEASQFYNKNAWSGQYPGERASPKCHLTLAGVVATVSIG